MKKKLNNIANIRWLLILLIFTACNKNESTENPKFKNLLFTCPMDPQIVSNTQGKCPICKMKLEIKTDISVQSISPSKQVLSSQSTIKITEADYSNRIKLSGITAIATSNSKIVPAKFGGRIEKLYVKYNFKYINEGDKIMEIYSPELVQMQEEYLYLFKSKNEKILLSKSRQKLILSGISENQVAEIERLGMIKNTITIYSPYSGYAIFNSSNQTTSVEDVKPKNGGMNMGSSSKSETIYQTVQISEGSYVNNRTKLFEVNDMDEKWVWLSVPSQFLNDIELNMSVNLETENGMKMKTKISLIEKNTDYNQSKFARIRVSVTDFENRISINSPVNAEIITIQNTNIQIPRQSVFFTGNGAIVWLKSGNLTNGNSIFKTTKIITGEISGNKVTVISGLNTGDEIARNAGMMTDSETILE